MRTNNTIFGTLEAPLQKVCINGKNDSSLIFMGCYMAGSVTIPWKFG